MIKLLNENCMNIKLPKCRLLLTDIPYDTINRNDNGLRNLNKGNADIATFEINDFLNHIYDAFDICIIFCSREQLGKISHFFNKKNGTTRQIVWCKTNPSPMNGEYTYFYAGDFLNAHKKLFEKNEYSILSYPTLSRPNYLVHGMTYSHIGMVSDNISYIKASIPSITFFSGNSNDVTLGFKESSQFENVYHTQKDNLDYLLSTYPCFFEKVNNVFSLTYDLLMDENFHMALKNINNGADLNIFTNKIFVVCVGVIFIIIMNTYLSRTTIKRQHKD